MRQLTPEERAQVRLAPGAVDRILRELEVKALTGLSRATRWRLAKVGKFPAPVQLTDTAIGWRASAISEWIASREEAAIARLVEKQELEAETRRRLIENAAMPADDLVRRIEPDAPSERPKPGPRRRGKRSAGDDTP
jgi:prophage regulatory protein